MWYTDGPVINTDPSLSAKDCLAVPANSKQVHGWYEHSYGMSQGLVSKSL